MLKDKYSYWFTLLLNRIGKPKSALFQDEWERLTGFMNVAIGSIWNGLYNFDALTILAEVDVYGHYGHNENEAYKGSSFISRKIGGYDVGRVRGIYADDPSITPDPSMYQYRVTPDGFIPFCDDAKVVWVSFIPACPEFIFSIGDTWSIDGVYAAMDAIEVPRFMRDYVIYRSLMDEKGRGNDDSKWYDRADLRANDILQDAVLADQKENGILSWGIVLRRDVLCQSQKFKGNYRGEKIIPQEIDVFDILPEWTEVSGFENGGYWVYTIPMNGYGAWAEWYIRVNGYSNAELTLSKSEAVGCYYVYGSKERSVTQIPGVWNGGVNTENDGMFVVSWTSNSSDGPMTIKSNVPVRIRVTMPGSFRPNNDKSPMTEFPEMVDSEERVYVDSLSGLALWKSVEPVLTSEGSYRYEMPLKKLWQKILILCDGVPGNVIWHPKPQYASLTHRVYGNRHKDGFFHNVNYEQTSRFSLFEVIDCYGSGASIDGGVTVFDSREKISLKYLNLN